MDVHFILIIICIKDQESAKEIIKQNESCQDRFLSERVLKIFAYNNVEISLNSSLIVKEKCLSILMD